MKRLILLIVTLAAAATRLLRRISAPRRAAWWTNREKAVEYATVVLLKGTEQVAGMATDAEGRFALKAALPANTRPDSVPGFDPVKKPVRVEQENHLGDFVMRTSATGIESVEVKARLVRREATGSWSTWRTPRRPSAGRHRTAGTRPRRMDRRGENINQRQRAARRSTSTTANCAWSRNSC